MNEEITIDQVIWKVVDELWMKLKKEPTDTLTKEETQKFLMENFYDVSETEEKFNQKDFDDAYSNFDSDENGVISRTELFQFLQKVAGYDKESQEKT